MKASQSSRLFYLILVAALGFLPDSGQAQEKVIKKAKKAATTAPAAPTTSVVEPSDAPIKFNTESDSSNTDYRQPMVFKIPGVSNAGEVKPDVSSKDPLPEAAPFVTYIGYPRHEVGVSALPMSVASKWSYNDQDFNFRSSATGYGAHYRIDVTPLFNLNLSFSQYSMSVTATTVSLFLVNESKETFQTYGAKGSYCWVYGISFVKRLCAGGSIDNDSYPILNFVDGTHLEISKVQDFVLGGHVNFQLPIVQDLALKFETGYNYGTGVGNTGNLTSKSNSSYYGQIQADWIIKEKHRLTAGVNYTARQAKLSGTVGAIKDKWKTDSTAVGGTFGYAYIF